MVDPHPARPDALPQPLVGLLSNEEWDALLVHVNGLIEEMEKLPGSAVRDRIFELLQGIDTIHRESLRRLVRLFKEGVLEKVISDPAIHTLLDLYDLLPEEPQQAQENSRGHAFPTIPIKAVSTTMQVTPLRYPRWVPMPQSPADLASGAAREVVVDEHPLLVCRREDKFFALESRCAQDGAALGGATLSGFTLTCPNHPGCHYDVRQGTRIGGGGRIQCYPVRLDDERRVLIGFDMEFKPDIPSF